MSKRLVGILFCVLLANVVNYALGRYLDDNIPTLVAPRATVDGSTLNTSRYHEQSAGAIPDTLLSADQRTLLSFYRYLDEGGSPAYNRWRDSRNTLAAAGDPFRLRALQVADASNAGKYLSLLLLALTILLLFGSGLRETSWTTPPLYLLIFGGTTVLYGGLSAPLFSGVVVGTLVLYFAGLRLFLPIYHTEWSRLMRPGLTLCCFLLAVMAWRGPELVDFWFWTSPLFRLGLVTVLLLTVFFHFSILRSVLTSAKMDGTTQLFAIGMPLGFAVLVPGLFLGLYGAEAGAALSRINYELVALPPQSVASFNPDAPFVLFFAGVMLLIIAGIGYFIQKIAR